MEIKFLGIEAKTQNKREKALVSIVNVQLERMVRYWLTDTEWEEDFKSRRGTHWMIQELGGQFSAMFYMDMIKEPITQYRVFEALENAVNEKRNETAA